MVDALEDSGLAEIAPTMVAGNGYVPGSAAEIAKRDDLCEGAKPRVHGHFFTEFGTFGSLDWNEQQVDDGEYEIVNDDTLMIGNTTFHYTIENGDTLSLEPVISKADLEKALANPDEFSDAGWSVAVAFPGHTWMRVPCDGWC